MSGGPTLSLTPWAHQALSMDEMTQLGQRLVSLHARATVMHSRNGWTIRVTSWAEDAHHEPLHREDRHQQKGHLADLINAAIDAYERRFVFTADELVTIAAQSGMAVTRG